MSKNPEQTWTAYTLAWKAASAEEQRAQFARSLTPTCVYTDPLVRAEGWDALVAYMDAFHEQVPGGHFQTTYFLAHSGRCIAKWNMVDAQGAVLSDGISYGEYGSDGKLLAMTGFFETPPSA